MSSSSIDVVFFRSQTKFVKKFAGVWFKHGWTSVIADLYVFYLWLFMISFKMLVETFDLHLTATWKLRFHSLKSAQKETHLRLKHAQQTFWQTFSFSQRWQHQLMVLTSKFFRFWTTLKFRFNYLKSEVSWDWFNFEWGSIYAHLYVFYLWSPMICWKMPVEKSHLTFISYWNI